MEAKEFGAYLREIRKKKNLTIRQLDTYSGVSNSYISQMERGERGVPSPDILLKLAKPLGVAYEDLMIMAGYIKTPTESEGKLKYVDVGDPGTPERDEFTELFLKDFNELSVKVKIYVSLSVLNFSKTDK